MMSLAPDTPECDCCAGVDASTPGAVSNPPGLTAIRYRIGRHADFLDSMRSRLSSTAYPALAALGTREASDFTLAITDALAATLDTLSFYTERYTQEHYLRTATERHSVLQMARLIGYRPSPGVAAATHLAFVLKSVPGVTLDPITIPVGTRVQSVPGQDETAQTFETVEAVPARAEWNAMPVQQARVHIPAFGDRSLWLEGVDAGLSVGDLILIVGAEHAADPQDERWDVRVITSVDIDQTRKLTRVSWQMGLGHSKPFVLPADESVQIFTFRKRTAVFGATAPDWKVLGKEAKLGYLGVAAPSDAQSEYDADEWPDFSALAPVYPERRSGTGGFIESVAAVTLEQVAAAATQSAQAAAINAMHGAAAAGTGIVMAGNTLAQNAFAMAGQSAQALTDVAQLAANEVTQRVETMLNAVPDDTDQPITTVLGNLAANLPGTVAGAIDGIVFDAPSTVADTASLLNPADALQSLGSDAAQVGVRAQAAAEATLKAAAAADVAALVSAAVTLARQLPAPLAPNTPEALAEVARHFAALGVVRAGGTPPMAPTASARHAQIEAMLPANLQAAVNVGDALGAMADVGEAIVNAPRSGALMAYQQIISQVDAALIGNLTLLTGKRAPLVRSPDRIDISPMDDKVVEDGWALLSVPNSVELYRITEAGVASRAEYLLSGQTTRLKLSGELPGGRLPSEFEHDPRALAVHVQSEELTLARQPIDAPFYGQTLALESHADGLTPGQAIVISGTRQRVRIARGTEDPVWLGDDGSSRTLAEGDSLELMAPPVKLVPAIHFFSFSFHLAPAFTPQPFFLTPLALSPEAFAAAIGQSATRLRLTVRDRDGAVGTVSLHGDEILLEAAHKDDEVVSEIAFLVTTADAITHDRDRSTLKLAEATRHVYVRLGTAVNANVAPATHGETVEAILGDGDGSRANQRFMLNQSPLTYVSAATPSGRASTLAVRINDVLWDEADTLYNAAGDARLYSTAQSDEAVTTVRFGDGIEGARLPGGSSNVRARYRKGLGVAGNVAGGKLTTLLSRPLGVSEVSNPEAATGGEDAEPLARARDNAPLTVLTLDRAVSIDDYANFARAFAGIDKAHALWIPAGPARGVFLTIAGVDGADVPASSDTYLHLLEALATYGDPLVPVRLVNYLDARFATRVAVKVDEAYEADAVLAAVSDALIAQFSFARRAFGQTVSVDEVSAVAQAVAGVVAVHVSRLYRVGQAAVLNPRLFASVPVASLTTIPAAAELLTLADTGIELEVLP
jgi:hypothetical protein